MVHKVRKYVRTISDVSPGHARTWSKSSVPENDRAGARRCYSDRECSSMRKCVISPGIPVKEYKHAS